MIIEREIEILLTQFIKWEWKSWEQERLKATDEKQSHQLEGGLFYPVEEGFVSMGARGFVS
jgi:arginine deiminase